MDIGCKDEFQGQLMNKMFIQTSTDFLIISLHVQSSFLTNHFLKLSRNLLNRCFLIFDLSSAEVILKRKFPSMPQKLHHFLLRSSENFRQVRKIQPNLVQKDSDNLSEKFSQNLIQKSSDHYEVQTRFRHFRIFQILNLSEYLSEIFSMCLVMFQKELRQIQNWDFIFRLIQTTILC